MHWYCLPQLPSVRVVSLGPCMGFFQMMGRVLGQFISHTCQVTNQLAAGMQPVSRYSYSLVVQSNSSQATLTMPIPHTCWFDEDVRPCWIRCTKKNLPCRNNGQTSVGRDYNMIYLVYMSWCKVVWNHLTQSPQVKWPVQMKTIFMRVGTSLPITLWYQFWWLGQSALHPAHKFRHHSCDNLVVVSHWAPKCSHILTERLAR